jgi:hypothetical protein
MVVPDEFEWRAVARVEFYPQMEEMAQQLQLCPYFIATDDIDDQAAMVLDVKRRAKACANRNPMGDRLHNWCYRCVAGLMNVKLHIYDAEADRDRALRV